MTTNTTGNNRCDSGAYIPTPEEIAKGAAMFRNRKLAAIVASDSHGPSDGRPKAMPHNGRVLRKAVGV